MDLIKTNIDRTAPCNYSDRRVCADRCESYDISVLEAIVESQSKALGMDEIIKPGCTVVIKPNLVSRKDPDEAATTHPEMVAAVIRAVKRRNPGRVIVAESSGGLYNKPIMSAVYSGCGISAICEREGAELCDDFSFSEQRMNEPLICDRFDIISPVVYADVLIGVSKLKTHCMTGLSGAVKNYFGCVPGLTKPEMHCTYPDPSQFQQMIVDLCTLVSPALSFVDAIDCMEGDGPTGGQKRHLGAVISARNPFCADLYCCHLIGVDSRSIAMLEHGTALGLCPENLAELELIDDVSELAVEFKKPRSRNTDFLDYLPAFLRPIAEKGEKFISPHPVINKNKCIGCGLCAQSCPQHTIVIIDKKKKYARIESDSCIKCYCCHEMCPKRAIDIKRTIVGKL